MDGEGAAAPPPPHKRQRVEAPGGGSRGPPRPSRPSAIAGVPNGPSPVARRRNTSAAVTRTLSGGRASSPRSPPTSKPPYRLISSKASPARAILLLEDAAPRTQSASAHTTKPPVSKKKSHRDTPSATTERSFTPALHSTSDMQTSPSPQAALQTGTPTVRRTATPTTRRKVTPSRKASRNLQSPTLDEDSSPPSEPQQPDETPDRPQSPQQEKIAPAPSSSSRKKTTRRTQSPNHARPSSRDKRTTEIEVAKPISAQHCPPSAAAGSLDAETPVIEHSPARRRRSAASPLRTQKRRQQQQQRGDEQQHPQPDDDDGEQLQKDQQQQGQPLHGGEKEEDEGPSPQSEVDEQLQLPQPPQPVVLMLPFPVHDESDQPPSFHCDVCELDLSHKFRVRCAQCVDYDLCVTCFVSGYATADHKNTHPYIPVGVCQTNFLHPAWTGEEELALLEAVSRLGLGNWGEVAAAVAVCETKLAKRKVDCEQHFYQAHCRAAASSLGSHRSSNLFSAAGSGSWSHLSPAEVQQARQEAHIALVGSGMPPCQPMLLREPPGFSAAIQGFMPNRGDFDEEWRNSHELSIADAHLRGDEAPQERELILVLLTSYCAVLSQRYQRKRLAVELGWADHRRLRFMESRRRAIPGLLPLLRLVNYHLPDAGAPHDELVLKFSMLLTEERALLQRVLLLAEWRAAGLTSHVQVHGYEAFRAACLRGPREPPPTVDGFEWLSPAERRLCATEGWTALQLLTVKGITLRRLHDAVTLQQWTPHRANVNGGQHLYFRTSPNTHLAAIDAVLAVQLP